jgi:4-amino-4-deoxychorismate lyase
MTTTDFIYTIDGQDELLDISSAELLSDRGLAYGHGLFESIRYFDGDFLLENRHLARIQNDSGRLGIRVNLSHMSSALLSFKEILLKQSIVDGIVKIIVTAGSGGRGYQSSEASIPRIILRHSVAPVNLQDYRNTGISLWRCGQRLSTNTQLAGIKHLNRLEQVLAASERHSSDCDDGLMMNDDGLVIETTRANIFFRGTSGRWITPDLDACGVSGVMRSLLIEEIFPLMGICPEIGAVGESDLDDYDELFICNSVRGIVPIVGIRKPDNQSTEKRAIGKVTRELQSMLSNNYPCFQ